MTLENTLSNNITSENDKTSYDNACKRLLANKIILAWIMKSCLKEYKDCSIKDIMEQYIEGEPEIATVAVHPDETNRETRESTYGMSNKGNTVTEGTAEYDIRFFAIAPLSGERIQLIINIENEYNFNQEDSIVKQAICSGLQMISEQYGTVFIEPHYEKIQKVCSIVVCLNPPKDRKNNINEYLIEEERIMGAVKETGQDYDLLTAIVIYLGKETDENYFGILKLLDTLLSSEIKLEVKKQILQEEYDITITTEIESELISISMYNFSDEIEQK